MTGSSATVYEYSVPAKSDAPAVDDIPFRIAYADGQDPDLFLLRRPKLSLAMGMVQLMEQEDEYTPSDFGVKLTHLLWGFVAYVKAEDPEPATMDNPDYDPDDDDSPATIPNPKAGRPRGRGRLLQRLNSPEDAMDITDLEPMFRNMVSVMFDRRPTGPSPESDSQPSAQAGTDSAAVTRVPPAKKSGTSRQGSSSRRARTSSTKGTKHG